MIARSMGTGRCVMLTDEARRLGTAAKQRRARERADRAIALARAGHKVAWIARQLVVDVSTVRRYLRQG